MWEVKAHPEFMDEALHWVCEAGIPPLEHNPQHVTTEVFTSTDHRIVVISKWRSGPTPLPDPPSHLVARSAHAWDFSPVDR